jgi:phage tail tube protein FII
MDGNVFDSECFRVYINGEVVKEQCEPISLGNLKRIAKEHGIKNFGVKTRVGVDVAMEDLPVEYDVVLSKIDKAGL